MSDPVGESILYKYLMPVAVAALGVISGVVGVKVKIAALEKSHNALKKSVRYVDTCEALNKAITHELDQIKKAQVTIQRDINKTREGVATLLERAKNL